jgi:hypothetical protein
MANLSQDILHPRAGHRGMQDVNFLFMPLMANHADSMGQIDIHHIIRRNPAALQFAVDRAQAALIAAARIGDNLFGQIRTETALREAADRRNSETTRRAKLRKDSVTSRSWCRSECACPSMSHPPQHLSRLVSWPKSTAESRSRQASQERY